MGKDTNKGRFDIDLLAFKTMKKMNDIYIRVCNERNAINTLNRTDKKIYKKLQKWTPTIQHDSNLIHGTYDYDALNIEYLLYNPGTSSKTNILFKCCYCPYYSRTNLKALKRKIDVFKLGSVNRVIILCNDCMRNDEGVSIRVHKNDHEDHWRRIKEEITLFKHNEAWRNIDYIDVDLEFAGLDGNDDSSNDTNNDNNEIDMDMNVPDSKNMNSQNVLN